MGGEKFGGGSIRDLWKAYEIVQWEALAKEAQALEFPLKILKLCLKAYACPRRVKLGGSLSREARVDASITAGCSIAKTLLLVLLYRASVRVGALSDSITLRVFIDDFGTQWMGDQIPGVKVLQQSMDKWDWEMQKLRMKDSVDKRAILVSDKRLLPYLRGTVGGKPCIHKMAFILGV